MGFTANFNQILILGHHPFGESFKRQANILAGDYNLSELKDPNSETSVSLIMKMIEAEPNKRPPAAAVLKHPIFWGKERILNFLQVRDLIVEWIIN